MPSTLSRRSPVLPFVAILMVVAAVAVAVAVAGLAAPPLASGSSTKVTMVEEQDAAADGALKQVIASCPSGYDITGGGYEIQSINPAIFVHQDTPLSPESNEGLWGWAVTLLNETGGNVTFAVFALCQKK